MNLSDFNYHLPDKYIAQTPHSPRDHSKLMLINKQNQTITNHRVIDLAKLLEPGDVLVFNDTKVIPARLYGQIDDRTVEILISKIINQSSFQAIVKPGKKFKVGQTVIFSKNINAQVIKIIADGSRIFKIDKTNKVDQLLKKFGQTPLPPYIKQTKTKNSQYQTIYAKKSGAIAAPTAGLHFTKRLFKKLKDRQIQIEFVTLHVGLGTFKPIKTDDITSHVMHAEHFELDELTADRLNKAKKANRRIIAVGTTVTRVLETVAKKTAGQSKLKAQTGQTDIFIYPGYEFKFVDALITNFHLPKSTLLLLVSAFGGQNLIKTAYQKAIKNHYRFFSFGDAMLIE